MGRMDGAALKASECARVSIYVMLLAPGGCLSVLGDRSGAVGCILAAGIPCRVARCRSGSQKREKRKNALGRLRVALGKCQPFPFRASLLPHSPSRFTSTASDILHLSPLTSGFLLALHFQCISQSPFHPSVSPPAPHHLHPSLNTLSDFTRSLPTICLACVVQGPGSLDQEILQGV